MHKNCSDYCKDTNITVFYKNELPIKATSKINSIDLLRIRYTWLRIGFILSLRADISKFAKSAFPVLHLGNILGFSLSPPELKATVHLSLKPIVIISELILIDQWVILLEFISAKPSNKLLLSSYVTWFFILLQLYMSVPRLSGMI